MYNDSKIDRRNHVLIAIGVFMLLIYPPGESVIINIQDESFRWFRTPSGLCKLQMLLIMMCAKLHFVCNIIQSNNIAYLTNKPNDVLSHGKMHSRQGCNPSFSAVQRPRESPIIMIIPQRGRRLWTYWSNALSWFSANLQLSLKQLPSCGPDLPRGQRTSSASLWIISGVI